MSGELERDVTRLSYLCGPYHGMRRSGLRWDERLAGGSEGGAHELALQAKQCVRIFAVAAPSSASFEMTLRDPGGTVVGAATSASGFVVLEADGAVCVSRTGAYEVRLRSVDADVRVVAEAWQF